MVQLTARPKEQGFLAGSLLLLSELLMNRVAMDLASSVPLLEGELTAGCDDNVLDQPLGRRLQAGTRHEIGGGAGWIVQGAYDDITAAVGDILSFSYTGGYHDVMLVDNGNCDFSGGTMLDETGSYQHTITEPGEYFFVCTKGSHCAGGQQQVRVIVPEPEEPAATDIGFTVADPSSCAGILPAATVQQWEDAIASNPVVMIAISNRGCTNAANTRLQAAGVCYESIEIDGSASSPEWQYLQCMHPQDRMCPTCGFSHSYAWIGGAYIGNGFAIRDLPDNQMTDRLVAAGASTDCGPSAATCAHHLNNAALEAAQIEQFVANPVMLFGWSRCPCTQIARERLTAAGVCFEEYTWDASTEPLMAYLNCLNPWAAGCPLRGAAGPGCSGGGEHHSFIYMDGQFIDNGFGFTTQRLPAARLEALTSGASAELSCGIAPPTGDPVFADMSHLLTHNPPKKNYGVSVTDIDGDGTMELFVAGFGSENIIYSWNAESQRFDSVATPALSDPSRSAIGVASCDIDGDGLEEIYVLNTDQYSGQTTTSDRIFRRDGNGDWIDMFEQPEHSAAANFIAGRSVACLDRDGDGKYGMFAANYGGPMKLYELPEDGSLRDVAPALGMDRTTGGRALIAGAFVSPDGHSMDLFANNENGCNFLYRNEGDGTFTEIAMSAGVGDCGNTGRGTVPMDADGDGVLDLVWGNWNGQHRMYVQDTPAHFTDVAPTTMAQPSRIRTVISADWDNDGQEELFYNNIPGENRLFTKEGAEWVPINVGDALEPTGHGTGAAYGDFDGDGCLELLVSHGESADEPLTYYRPSNCGTNHYLRVMPLTQYGGPARGATVRLAISGRVNAAGVQTHIRNIDAGSGYLVRALHAFRTLSPVVVVLSDMLSLVGSASRSRWRTLVSVLRRLWRS